MGVITDKDMQARVTGADQWLTEDAPRGAGRFMARISRSGDRTFYFRHTTSSGDRDTLKLGSYHPTGVGGMTLAEARKKSKKLSELYQSGVKDLRNHLEQERADLIQAAELQRQRIADEQRKIEEAQAAAALAQARRLTVRQLFDRWRSTDLQPVLRTDGRRDGRKDGGKLALEQFTRHVFPSIGDMAVEEVRKADLLAVIDAQKAKGQMRTAQMLLGELKQMLGFALDRELIQADPLATVKKARVVGAPVMRDRYLSEEEIRQLPQAIAQAHLSPRSAAAIWLTLATGVRVGELMGAVWASDLPIDQKARMARIDALRAAADADDVKLGLVDTAARTWHLPTTKNERDHTIHLSDFALQQVQILAQYRETMILPVGGSETRGLSPWIFPSTDNARPVCVKSFGKQLADRQRKPEQRLSRRTKASTALVLPGGRWTAHDLRRTTGTTLAALGFSGDVIDECLNHVIESRMRRTYVKDRREADQARAFDALGEYLHALIKATSLGQHLVRHRTV